MKVEHGRRLEPRGPITDPQAFLDRPFERLQVERLAEPPSREFLEWLPNFRDTAGLYSHTGSGDWYVIKASDSGVPSWMVPPDAAVFLYSHFKIEGEDPSGIGMPSPRDLSNASGDVKNLIVSATGITEYKRVEDEEARRELGIAIHRGTFDSQRDGVQQEYIAFLSGIGAEYAVHPWDSITQEKLAELLSK